MRVALCNTFEYNPNNLLEIIDAIDHPRMELAFDVGHCLVWGRMTPLDWYRKIRDKCGVVYVHSNDGNADRHCSIKTGVLAKQGILNTLGHELRSDSVMILKYFDKKRVEEDIDYLASTLGQEHRGARHPVLPSRARRTAK